MAQAQQAYNAQLALVKKAKDALKQAPHPEWPTEFAPVDPDGPEATRPPKPRPATPATAAGDTGAAPTSEATANESRAIAVSSRRLNMAYPSSKAGVSSAESLAITSSGMSMLV